MRIWRRKIVGQLTVSKTKRIKSNDDQRNKKGRQIATYRNGATENIIQKDETKAGKNILGFLETKTMQYNSQKPIIIQSTAQK